MMVDIDEDVISTSFLTGNSPQRYQRYILVVKFLLQHLNILNIIENIGGMKIRSETLGISHIEGVILLLSWEEGEWFLLRAARGHVRVPMKHHPFHAPSFHKSGRRLSRELHHIYQKRDTTSSLFFPAFLCKAPFKNETKSMTMELLLFDSMLLHEYAPRNNPER